MRQKHRSSKFNYIYSSAYQILNLLMPLATAPYLARVIGPSGVGIYSYTNVMAGYFAMFGLLGLTNYGSRTIAKCRDNQDKMNKTFSSLVILQVSLCLFVSILYTGYIITFVKDNLLISWLQIFVIFSSLINFTWFFWGIEEFKITVTRNFIVKIINFLCVFIFVRESEDLWKYTLIMAIGTFVGNLPLVFILKKYVKFVPVNIEDILKHLRPNLILFVPILSTSLYRTIAKLMLKWMAEYAEVGYYENADKIINICLGFVTALGQVMMPKASYLMEIGKIDECNRLTKKTLKFVTLLSSAIAFGILAVAKDFVPLFFGEAFVKTTPVLMILAPCFMIIAWSNVIKTQILMAREKDSIYVGATILGVICNIILNCGFISMYQATGAAIATLITEIVVLIYIVIRIKTTFSIVDSLKQSMPYIIIGLIMLFSVKIFNIITPSGINGLIISIFIGGAIYILSVIIWGILSHDEVVGDIINLGTKMLNKIRGR